MHAVRVSWANTLPAFSVAQGRMGALVLHRVLGSLDLFCGHHPSYLVKAG